MLYDPQISQMTQIPKISVNLRNLWIMFPLLPAVRKYYFFAIMSIVIRSRISFTGDRKVIPPWHTEKR